MGYFVGQCSTLRSGTRRNSRRLLVRTVRPNDSSVCGDQRVQRADGRARPGKGGSHAAVGLGGGLVKRQNRQGRHELGQQGLVLRGIG